MADTITLKSGATVRNFKSRLHCIELYPDNPEHPAIMEGIRKSYQYLAIMHDADLTDDGKPKKPHYHVMLQFRSAKWASALADELGLEANLILGCPENTQPVQTFDGMARYFLHLDHPDKTPYEFEALEGNLKDRAEGSCVGKESESERVLRLLDLLEKQNRVLTMKEFVKLVCQAGLYSDCRRAGYLMKTMLDEHNVEVQMCADGY